jgi:hypothetical protein
LQRQRERGTLVGTHAWDIELVADDEWGRVLVAQRDFAPGDIVIRSRVCAQATTAAEYVRACDAISHGGGGGGGGGGQGENTPAQYIEWATSSPRQVPPLLQLISSISSLSRRATRLAFPKASQSLLSLFPT